MESNHHLTPAAVRDALPLKLPQRGGNSDILASRTRHRPVPSRCPCGDCTHSADAETIRLTPNRLGHCNQCGQRVLNAPRYQDVAALCLVLRRFDGRTRRRDLPVHTRVVPNGLPQFKHRLITGTPKLRVSPAHYWAILYAFPAAIPQLMLLH